MSTPRRRWMWLWTLGALAIVALGVLPYGWLLDVHPQSRDAVIWLQKADPSQPGWLGWTFATPQFKVTLRPVAALTYTITRTLGGLSPQVHRGFDLALHGLVIGLGYGVMRRWSTRATAASALAAAAFTALHPLARYVVPDLARRSYPLATALVLAALLATPRNDAPPAERARRGLLAAGVAGLAALSHEVGYVAFGLCALLVVPPAHALRDPAAWLDGVRHQRWLVGGSGVLGVALLVWRIAVMGGLGGYHHGWPDPPGTLLATLESLVPLYAVDLTAYGWLGALWAALVLGVAGVEMLRETRRGPPDPVLRVALAWIVGGLLLFVPQPVWFIRQSYLLVAPAALIVGSLLGAARPRLAVAAALASLGGLVGVGPSEIVKIGEERVRAERTSDLVDDLIETAWDVPLGGHLVLAIPRWRNPRAVGRPERGRPAPDESEDEVDDKGLPIGIRAPVSWVETVVPRRRFTLALVAFTTIEEAGPVWRAELRRRRLEIEVDGPRRVTGLPYNRLARIDGDRATVRLPKHDGEVWFYVHDGRGSRTWVVEQRARK